MFFRAKKFSMDKAFVFVVCGAKEHLDTLNFSLRALKRFSRFPILVVTDLKRNETGIDHPLHQIIDILVNEKYNHHQASIYLKTGLHRFLPMENNLYCYLDTDVVALNSDASTVFSQYQSPITFATDHCRMNKFSPVAVNCDCAQMPYELQGLLDRYAIEFQHLMKNQETIDEVLNEWRLFKKQFPLEQLKNQWFDGLLNHSAVLESKRARLSNLTDPHLAWYKLFFNYLFKVFPNYKRSLFVRQWKDRDGNVLLDEGPEYHRFMNAQGFFYDRKSSVWRDSHGTVASEIPKTINQFLAEKGLVYKNTDQAWYTTNGEFFMPNITKLIEKNSQYWYDAATDTWYDEVNSRVFINECNHLQEAIKKDFGVDVKQPDWQHWNGGVFLFDKDSVPFLDTWHKLTLNAFSLPNWKTRDQGTLITTVWKLGLENQPVLPIEFNFIADYYHPTIIYEGDFKFRIKVGKPTISPAFIHIYHHWGDEGWNVWRDVYQHISKS